MAGLVGIMGAKRSGKDTLAGFLVEDHGFTRLAFADKLKDFLLDVNPLTGRSGFRVRDAVDLVGWDEAKETPEVRRLLQEVGLAAREHLGPRVWLDPVMQEADRIRWSKGGNGGPVVITDVRFANEWQAVKEAGGILVRVVRSGVTRDDAHVSESLAWDPSVPVDVTIANSEGLDKLRADAGWLAGIVF